MSERIRKFPETLPKGEIKYELISSEHGSEKLTLFGSTQELFSVESYPDEEGEIRERFIPSEPVQEIILEELGEEAHESMMSFFRHPRFPDELSGRYAYDVINHTQEPSPKPDNDVDHGKLPDDSPYSGITIIKSHLTDEE